MTTDMFIFSVMLLINALLTVAMLLAARTLGQHRVAMLLAASFGSNVLLYVVNAIYFFHFYGQVWPNLVVAMVAMVPPTFAVSAYRLRAGLPSWRNFFISSHLAASVLILWFSFAMPHAGLRGAIVPLYAAMILFFGVTSMWRPGRPLLLGERPIIFTGCAMAATAAAGGIVLAIGGSGNPAAVDEAYVLTVFLGLPAMTVAAGIFSLYLLAGDLAERLRIAADTDSLTGAPNRRAIEASGMRLIAETRAAGQPLSLAICDVDHFKDINDLHGHGHGDEVLCKLAGLFREHVANADHYGRFGGEEFILFFPGVDIDEAHRRVEVLRDQIMALRMDGLPALLTASFGVAATARKDRMVADIIKRADRALYASKEAGRNRTTVDRRSEPVDS